MLKFEIDFSFHILAVKPLSIEVDMIKIKQNRYSKFKQFVQSKFLEKLGYAKSNKKCKKLLKTHRARGIENRNTINI